MSGSKDKIGRVLGGAHRFRAEDPFIKGDEQDDDDLVFIPSGILKAALEEADEAGKEDTVMEGEDTEVIPRLHSAIDILANATKARSGDIRITNRGNG